MRSYLFLIKTDSLLIKGIFVLAQMGMSFLVAGAFDYSRADLDKFWDYKRDIHWKNIFTLCVSANPNFASEFKWKGSDQTSFMSMVFICLCCWICS